MVFFLSVQRLLKHHFMLYEIAQRQLCWCPPPEGFVKINSGGAFNQSSHEVGIGVVARNSTGEFAHEKGCRDVHIETDSATVVNKFNRIRPDISVLGSQVEHYRPLLGEFNVCLINFTPKCCNSVAHTLATHASSSGLSFFFGSDCPVLIPTNVLAGFTGFLDAIGVGMVFFSPRRWCDCVYSAWPAWFASPDTAPGSLALVATAARGSRSGLVLATISRVRDGPRARPYVSFPPSPRYGSAQLVLMASHDAALGPW
ncbi:hypothetical protein V6N11_018416 [Hibiscus sabdariffa]|uniref:RNase H type-1 domain-containing protein n=1 Tax=Hibiscus sabdariffa TaxID=183260 RepID=A0ABR2T885_9ROSI